MRLWSVVLKAVAALFTSAQIASADMPVMSADKAFAAAEAGELVLIDIRTPEEWAATGLPEPSVGINLRNASFVDEIRAIMAKHEGVPVAMICASGARSTFATTELGKHGFDSLINIPEGMAGSDAGPGWLKRGLPVRQP